MNASRRLIGFTVVLSCLIGCAEEKPPVKPKTRPARSHYSSSLSESAPSSYQPATPAAGSETTPSGADVTPPTADNASAVAQPATPEKSQVVASQATAAGPIMKIAVKRDGSLSVDGKTSSMASLTAALEELAKQHGSVWYYREAAKEEPHPVALQVIDAVIKVRVPIRLSTRPDYSDTVDVDRKEEPKAK